MGRIEMVMDAFGIATQAAIANLGMTVPAQGYKGWPVGSELTEILNQGQYAVSFYPLPGGRKVQPRGFFHQDITVNVPTLTVNLDQFGSTLTFGGTVSPCNLNVIINHPFFGNRFAYYRVQSFDSLSSIAIVVAAAINTLPPGVSAFPNGSSVTVSGSRGVKCNIGGSGTITQEVLRVEQRMQISVWAPTAFSNSGNPAIDNPLSLRSAITDVIISNIGSEANPFLITADGKYVRVKLSAPPRYVDDSQSDYNVYESHIIFTAEYAYYNTDNATQVGVIEEFTSIGGLAPVTTIGG